MVSEEQNFLKVKYDQLKKERDLDPRSHFQLNNKGHSSQHNAKFANGALASEKTGSPASASSLSAVNAEEQMNARLVKLSQRVSRALSSVPLQIAYRLVG